MTPLTSNELEATAQLLDTLMRDAAKNGGPFQWDPAEVVREAARQLGLTDQNDFPPLIIT